MLNMFALVCFYSFIQYTRYKQEQTPNEGVLCVLRNKSNAPSFWLQLQFKFSFLVWVSERKSKLKFEISPYWIEWASNGIKTKGRQTHNKPPLPATHATSKRGNDFVAFACQCAAVLRAICPSAYE
jgi:hypothetical protein